VRCAGKDTMSFVSLRASSKPMIRTKGPTPKWLKCLLSLSLGLFGLLGIRLLPFTFAEGWIPGVTLLITLGLVLCALVEVVRAR
jgi:hypothetical protein